MENSFLPPHLQEELTAIARARGMSVEQLVSAWATQHQDGKESTTAFFDLASDLLSISNSDGYFVKVSPSFEKTLGHDSATLLTTPFIDFVHTEDRARTLDALKRVSEGQTVLEFENRYRCADGGYRWLAWTSTPQSDGLIYSIARDITDRRHLENVLLEQTQTVVSLLESMGDAFFAVNPEWRFTYVNNEGEKLLRRPRGELLGRSVWEEFPEAVGSIFYERYHYTAETGEPVSFTEYYPPLETWFDVHAERNAAGLSVFFRDVTARRAAEEQLRQSEERYRAIVESQIDYVSQYTLDGVLTFVNEAYAKAFGRKTGDLIGQDFLQFVDPEHLEMVRQRLETLRTDPRPAISTVKGINVHGEPQWIEWVDHGITDAEGRVIGVQAVGRDVTRLKIAENRLAEQEAYFRLLFERNPLPMWVFEYDTLRFLQVNEAAISHYGYSREEFLSMTIKDIRPLEDVDTVVSIADQLSQSADLYAFHEWRHKRKDGTLIDVEISSHDVSFGKTKGRLVLANDITERKRVERALRESEERFRTIFEDAAEGMLLLDERGTIVLANHYIEILFGYDRSELFGRELDLLLPMTLETEPSATALDPPLAPPVDDIQRVTGRHKHGDTLPIEIKLTPVVITDRQMTLCFLTNVTERHLLEQERLYAQSLELELQKERELITMRERFLSFVSHEFRTPLSVIQVFVDMLLRYQDKLSKERVQEKLNGISDQVQRMAALLEDVLLVSRGKAKRLEFRPEPVDVSELCIRILDYMQSSDPYHAYEVRLELKKEQVRADRRLLEHILVNLLNNAAKYSEPGKLIRFHGRRTETEMIFVVQDHGIGIPEADQEHLFEPFQRASNVGSISGTGLGLAIVRQSAEAHGGTVTVESQVGKGSTFTVTLPL